ncbi:MAG TPA: NUDIX domain-containing protein [Streptosporangiaceae bacterium]|nr:NUDIX domain-containing protein [Streptosporangiaceae bacterium]
MRPTETAGSTGSTGGTGSTGSACSAGLRAEIRALVAGLLPADATEAEHQSQVLAWVDGTADIFRRVSSRTPSPHLVSYFLPVDPASGSVLLADHRKSGLWLPPGGHVEPGEHPAETVRRETREELGIDARFCPLMGERPAFVTVTPTVPGPGQHTDVSLWFVLECCADEELTPDPAEFRGVHWWSRPEIARADPGIFDPHFRRMLAKIDGERTR